LAEDFAATISSALFSTSFLSKQEGMNMRELTQAARVTERQVRYLIAEGFIPAPRGGRATAEYGDDHLAAIGRYNRLRELGFPPAAIKLLLQAREGAPFAVAPGISLVVDPSLLGTGADPKPLIERIAKLLTDLLKDNFHADRPSHLD
jgi:MerR family transcriptional regulator, copper efflux regulator